MASDDLTATFEMLDERFRGIRGDRHFERLWTGGRWTEGPVYLPTGRSLLFSDIPNDRILRWDEPTGHVGVYRQPAGHTNGHTLDGEGRLVSCEHGARRVSRTEHDGSVTVLADRFEGKRFNSPNDVVVRSDGSVWFSDPAYGIDSDYEGHRAESEIGSCNVYRIDPSTGGCTVVADDFDRPNGLAFSLDESLLYVADTPRGHLRVFDVDGDRLRGGAVFAECDEGGVDGLRLDDAGRIWLAAGPAVHCFAPDGTRIGRLGVPETVSNLEFGGPKRHRLFLCGTTSLYSIMTTLRGARRPFDRG